jgi:putative flippase GtrA
MTGPIRAAAKLWGEHLRHTISRVTSDQRIRFLAVGATNTVVGYVVFAALTHWVFGGLPFGYLLSLIISYALSIILAFYLYRRFVFHVSGNVLIDLLRFVGVYAVSIGINILVLPLLVELLHIPVLISQALVLITTTLVSFFGHKTFSFRRAADETPETLADGEQAREK